MDNKLKSIKVSILVELFAVISFLTSTVIYYASGDKLLSSFNLITVLLISFLLVSDIKKYKSHS